MPNRKEVPLIQRRGLQTLPQRTLWGTLTAIAWAIYFYLFLPIITAVLWALGIRSAFFHAYKVHHQVDWVLVQVVPLIALAATAIMVGWAEYNRIRFQRHCKRSTGPAPVTQELVAADMGASMGVATAMLAGKNFIVHMDDHARPVGISPRTGRWPPPRSPRPGAPTDDAMRDSMPERLRA